MEAVNYINTMSASLVRLVAIGGIFSSGYFALKWITAEDEHEVARCKKNIKKVLIGVILGLTVTGLIRFILGRL